MLTVHNIINNIFNNSDINYLELGLMHGEHFNNLNIRNKESVDVVDRGGNGTPTHLMTTDDFFSRNSKKYDIIFIDADHDHRQVIKDFNNSVDALKNNGIIFLHDLYPATLDLTQKNYCDDSYKILDYFIKNGFNIIVNSSDHGSTCVFNPAKIDPNEVLSDLSWEVFIDSYKINNNNILPDLGSFVDKFKLKNTINIKDKISNAFSSLKKHRRAYVICSVGQKYIDMVETLVNQLYKYSEYPVFLYYSNGDVNFDSPNLIKQKFQLKNFMDYNIHGMDPETVKSKMLTLTKPIAFDLFVKNYDVEEFVFLDSDVLVTPSIDIIFNKYSDLIENSPIFIRYSWDIVTVNGRPHTSDIVLERTGSKRKSFPGSVCSGIFIANKNCKSFFSDWTKYCFDEELIRYCVENNEAWGEINDESTATALVWLYGGKNTIVTDFVWAWTGEAVKFVFDFYDGKVGNLPKHESLSSHYRIPPEHEIPYGLSVIPQNKLDLLGTHGIKDLEEIKKAAEEIDKRFFI